MRLTIDGKPFAGNRFLQMAKGTIPVSDGAAPVQPKENPLDRASSAEG